MTEDALSSAGTGQPSWEGWSDRLAEQAARVVELVGGGQPGPALNLLDEMLADLDSRRRTVAELANDED